MNKQRCEWCTEDVRYQVYHDTEWGRPVHDEQVLFEFLVLEGAQAGLSWLTILKKRENYRQHFANFDPKKVANFTNKQLEHILLDPGVVRNRLKIFSVRQNAQAFLKIQQEFGTFDHYIWSFVAHKPIQKQQGSAVFATSPISDAMSKDLKKRGFTFVGSTICYAFMQAVGLVNDHSDSCFLR